MTQDPTIGVIEKSDKPIVVLDIYSKLLQDNIIFVNDIIDSVSVSKYQSELLYLKSALKSSSQKVITMYINSPGGSVYDAFGLYDTMKLLESKGYIINTVNVGLAASAAAVLLMAGTKGHRQALPNSTVMVHELSSAAWGKISNISVEYKEIERLQKRLGEIITENSCAENATVDGKDHYMDAKEAQERKIIDKII